MKQEIVDWLMDGDPGIRWQVMRDLLEEPEKKWGRERERTAKTGWGLRILKCQNADGNWGRGIYSPKWTSTTYTLLLLKHLGFPAGHPAMLKACRMFMDGAFQSDTGGMWNETCISGMALSVFCYFGLADGRIEKMAQYFLDEQMPDGGWNCRKKNGATHSSFHTTINVLEGLREYLRLGGSRAAAIRKAEGKGCEFFLKHRIYCSHRTGKIVHPDFLQLSFPPRWHHDNLRALDYFRDSAADRDGRLAAGIEALVKKRRKDGTWPLQHRYAGVTFFEMEKPGKPSRWNTLRALRVLKWWDAG